MHSTEQRRLAIETFIRFGHSYADTIAELGYPGRHTLNSWWRECRETGEVPVGKMVREPRFSDGQKREAVEHCLGHGKSLSRTMRARLPEGQRHAELAGLHVARRRDSELVAARRVQVAQ